VASVSSTSISELTELGLSGTSASYPVFQYQVTPDSGAGYAAGTAVVQANASITLFTTGTSDGTSTAEATYEAFEAITTLGLGGYSVSYPLYLASTSDQGAGSAFGTSTVLGVSDVAIIEDIGDPDYGILSSITISAAATVATNVLEVTPSGGISFGGTAPRLKGFTYSASGGFLFSGTASAVKSRTVEPVRATSLTFSGTGGGSPNQIQNYIYSPTGGIILAGQGSVSFFKDFGPGATGKIRDKRRITFSTRSYSRG
jgi:hypothetical protein